MLFLGSCGSLYNLFHDRPENTDKYLQQFRQEAAERGVDITYPKRFQIRLVDYMSGTRVGYCYNDIPMKIDLDRNFWTSADTTQQKILFFHELGHCMLNRKHYNAILPNGEWKSLMRGSPIPEKRDYVINMSGFRIDYYLDELFDPESPLPEWATFKKDLGRKGDLIFGEDFSTNDKNWKVLDEPDKQLRLSNSGYEMSNDMEDESLSSTKKIAIDPGKDLQIVAEFSLRIDSLDSSGGMIFGTRDRLEYFLIDKKFGFRFGNNNEFRPYTNIPLPDSLELSDLSMTLELTDDRLYYYVGSQMIYTNDIVPPAADSIYVGFNIAPDSKINVKRLQVFN